VSRLIFVEGFPGAGKSTTAQFLARRFAHGGGRVRWIYEGEVPNPLVPPQPAGGDQSWEQFADRRVARWRAFAAAADDEDVTLIPESALLQLPVFTMLRRNVDPSVIAALVVRLVEAVSPLSPTLVYLARRDPGAAFRALGESRGLAWLLPHVANCAGYTFVQARGLFGLDGLLAYWRAHADLCGAIIDRLDVPKLVLDVDTGDWPERRRRICAFVDVPFENQTSPGTADLARMAGRYRNGPREVTIEVVDGGLRVRLGLWRTNALLPVRRNVFDVESWPMRVSFDDEVMGHVRAFHLSSPRLAWGGPSGVFERIA
jgi:hypothetical protein